MSRGSRAPLSLLSARRIALLKPSALGDIVHSLPVLSALRARFPEAHITWIVNQAYEPLLLGHPDLNATLSFDRASARRGIWSAAQNYARFAEKLRQQAFDLVIDLQGLLRSGLMTWATAAPRRIGLSSAREGAAWFYTDTLLVPDRLQVHAVDRYWAVASALGVGNLEKQFKITIQPAERGWAQSKLAVLPRPAIAVAAGSRWETKRWRPEHFAMLLRRALDHFGGSAVFVGTNDEAELSDSIGRQLNHSYINLAGATTVPQLAAVLGQADAMLANDTGPLHLAAALGRPVIAPYTCTKAVATGPYQGVAVETKVWCAGSCVKRCRRLECMDELTPDRLWPALHEVMQAWVSRNSRSA